MADIIVGLLALFMAVASILSLLMGDYAIAAIGTIGCVVLTYLFVGAEI